MLDQIRNPSDIPFEDDPNNDPCLIEGSVPKTEKFFREEFERLFQEGQFESREDWYENGYLVICREAGFFKEDSIYEPMPRQRAENLCLAAKYIKHSTVKPTPTPKPVQQTNTEPTRAEILDMTKTQIASDAEYEKASERVRKGGISMHYPCIPPDALEILEEIGSMKAVKLYYTLSGNMHIHSGKTHKRSRKELSETLGVSRRTWTTIEKKMVESGLIEYHEEDIGHSWKQKVSFFLPHIPDWMNVQRIIKNYESQGDC